MMWPLLLVSVACVAVIFERLWFIFTLRRDRSLVQQMLAAVNDGQYSEASRLGSQSQDFVARVLSCGIENRDESLTDSMLAQANLELRQFSKGLYLLDTAITISPLLGLLGTVTGMIHSFGLLGGQELSTPTVITGGIAEALIATASGLAIAISAVIPFNFLNSRLEVASDELQVASTRLETLFKRRKNAGVSEQPYAA